MFCTTFGWRNRRESDHLEEPDIDGRIILKRISRSGMGVTDCIVVTLNGDM